MFRIFLPSTSFSYKMNSLAVLTALLHPNHAKPIHSHNYQSRYRVDLRKENAGEKRDGGEETTPVFLHLIQLTLQEMNLFPAVLNRGFQLVEFRYGALSLGVCGFCPIMNLNEMEKLAIKQNIIDNTDVNICMTSDCICFNS